MKAFLVTFLLAVLAAVLLAYLSGCGQPCGDPGRAERSERAHRPDAQPQHR